MEWSLEGQVALVTGASRGIGAAIADRLAGLGALVVGTATTETGAAAISERLKDLDDQCRGVQLDVNEAGASEQLISQITTELGAPTILINNAGITRDQLLMRMKDDDDDEPRGGPRRPIRVDTSQMIPVRVAAKSRAKCPCAAAS